MACFFSSSRTPRPPRVKTMELETTMSTCTTEAVRRRHVFVIKGYKNLLGRVVGADEFVSSDTFEVGGYDWRVDYYPRGNRRAKPGYTSVFVQLVTPGAQARASYEVSLAPMRLPFKADPHLYRDESKGWGFASFMERTKVEMTGDDSITIECAITVFTKPTNSSSKALPPCLTVPPSEVSKDLAKLLDEGAPPADVLILVGAESFAAHSFVLWMRCRELHDQITSSSCITIPDSDVQAAVIRDLLHYSYTDTLPGMDDLDSAQKAEKIRALLPAAVRYKIDRLKLLCESMLCTSLEAGTVVATLAVAEQLQLTTLSKCLHQVYRRCSRADRMMFVPLIIASAASVNNATSSAP